MMRDEGGNGAMARGGQGCPRQVWRMDRRAFLCAAALYGGGALAAGLGGCGPQGPPVTPTAGAMRQPTTTKPPAATHTAPASATPPAPQEGTMTRVALVKTDDRAQGVRRALDLLGLNPLKDKEVFLKPNFNSADPAPGSTHPDTLRALVEWTRAMGAARIKVGDRSGMGDTRRVMQQLGVLRMAQELGFETLVFDRLGAGDWVSFAPAGSHWSRGFALAGPLLEAEAVVQTCCLKTHRYGGHFTMALKNSVGAVAKVVPGEGYNYMRELHSSPAQRLMIAEINLAYTPDLVLLDGVEAFVDGGPDRGTKVAAQVVMAGTDRVAIDALGVAVLRLWGTTPEVSAGPVFAQEQIARAAELGLGVSAPEQIEVVTADPASRELALRLSEELRRP